MKILVTGAAGFIGSHLIERLHRDGHEVVGLDCINDYYDVKIKYGRLSKSGINESQIKPDTVTQSAKLTGYSFVKMNLENKHGLDLLFKDHNFDAVCNLAAQAGVRYSITNPDEYIQSNIVGFMNILECCRKYSVRNLSYASSSSVYGLNSNLPFKTNAITDHPVSLYAASKKSNELMAHTYSHLYNLQTTGLRFFTVYGPWGRPDMALFKFVKAALEGTSIDVYNNGEMIRDFTYVDDIVLGITNVMYKPAKSDITWKGSPASSSAPYKVYNIGNNHPVKLMDFISAIEEKVGREIKKNMLPIQPGDVPATYACVDDLEADMQYKPSTTVKHGIDKFVDWYRDFYGILEA